MNIKLNAVAIVVVASMSGGMSIAHAGFNETPYVSYLSGDDFDAAFSVRQVTAVLNSDSPVVVHVADTSQLSVGAKKQVDSKGHRDLSTQTGKIEQNISLRPATEVPASTIAPVEAPASPSCAAEEIGYNAPCI